MADYVDCGNDNSLKMGRNSFTLEAWIKTSTTKRMGIIGNYADNLMWKLGVYDDGTVGMQSNTGDWNTGYVLSTKTMTDGDWHYLVGTREYGGKIKSFKIISGSKTESFSEIKSGDYRTFEYTLRATGSGKFTCDPATATYKDADGNSYSTASNSVTLQVGGGEAPAGADSDGDGWSDAKEREMGTNPYSVDSDSDGLKDPEDPNPTVPEAKKGIPGYEAVCAIAGLLAAAYLIRSRKRK